jgi:uroporphyrinogen III methyltransferase/synthase
MKQGVVHLVGAGPGDPDLITVAGVEILKQADVVLYDRLANPRLLDYAPPRAERVFVGKFPGEPALSQDEINGLLVEYANEGKRVVRLKGGDPFVFGRGGEEAAACAAAGIEWHVVPGVSSALGVPAVAGIPLTHRDYAGAFAIVTGHSADEFANVLDWAALARIDTVVILMGIENLAHIAISLVQGGKGYDTPVAIVERGTTRDERVIVGTLGSIVEIAEAAQVRSPAVIVVGQVVRLREALLTDPRLQAVIGA